jgi:hypothetical protein
LHLFDGAHGGRFADSLAAALPLVAVGLAPGKHTIVFDFASDGPGIAKGCSGVLKVDGQEQEPIARARRLLLAAANLGTRTGLRLKVGSSRDRLLASEGSLRRNP